MKTPHRNKPVAVPAERLKGRPSFPFETIALAVAFSPKLEAMLHEARQLADICRAKLLLIHVGPHSEAKEETLAEICANMGIDREVKTIWRNGDPVDMLLETCKQHAVDLLVLGARRRENVFRYFLGSIARSLSRRAKCSLLLLTEPQVAGTSFRKIVVDCVENPKTPHVLNTAFYFAGLVGASELRAVREITQTDPADPEDGSIPEKVVTKDHLMLDAEKKLRAMTAGRASTGLTVKSTVLSGRPGFTIRNFANDSGADLLAIHSPDGAYKIIDRIFTRDMEHILEHLPCNLLIVHARAKDED